MSIGLGLAQDRGPGAEQTSALVDERRQGNDLVLDPFDSRLDLVERRCRLVTIAAPRGRMTLSYDKSCDKLMTVTAPRGLLSRGGSRG